MIAYSGEYMKKLNHHFSLTHICSSNIKKNPYGCKYKKSLCRTRTGKNLTMIDSFINNALY